MAKIFLSSTFVEMEEYRDAAFAAIEQYGHVCVRMETFPASDRAIPEFCRARVAECDLFVLVLGQFYGTLISGREISHTEDEFDAAVALGKARLVFVPAESAETNIKAALASMKRNELIYEQQEKRQEAFRTKALDGVTPRTFKDTGDLRAQVGYSLHARQSEAPRPKEPWINLPNTRKEILAREGAARKLVEALSRDGPGIVSIAAPPGFGKSSVFALAVRLARAELRWLDGIAVLDGSAGKAGFAEFANLVGRMSGPSPDNAFFDLLGRAGKVWLVVENAQAVLASAEFREVLKEWCGHDHQAKLLLLTREALHQFLDCHKQLRDVELALLGGLPPDAAIVLLRERLAETRFRGTAESLLRQIAQKLHHVPMALEQFATYLRQREQGIELNQRFVDQNDLLRLDPSEQLIRMVGENLKLLDNQALELMRVVAWARMPVPHSGLLALQGDCAERLTSLVRSNMLLAQEGTASEGRSFDMHPLIRESLKEWSGVGFDFGRIRTVVLDAGKTEWEQGQFRPALSLFTLAELAARHCGGHEELARAVMGRGFALGNLGRLDESLVAFNESIVIHRVLVEQEGRRELRNDLARAIMNRGVTLADLGRLEEAVAAYEESMSIRRELVERESRQELRNDLAKAIMNRGSALGDLGRFEEAVAAYEESIGMYRELVEPEGRRDLCNDLAVAIMNEGNALCNLGRFEEGVAAYEESIGIHRELVEREARRELRNDLARAIMNRGIALEDLGRFEEAVAAYDESISIGRELVEGEGRREWRNDLARPLYHLALARDKQGAGTAIEAAREARILRQEMVNEGMTHLTKELAAAKELEARLCRDSHA